VEVKFRKAWNEPTQNELHETLSQQVTIWDPTYLVLFFGETPSRYYPENPASWVRATKLTMVDGVLSIPFGSGYKPWLNIVWNDMSRIQDVFPQLNSDTQWEGRFIEASLQISRGLIDLQ
jgi:hypothetical protein